MAKNRSNEFREKPQKSSDDSGEKRTFIINNVNIKLIYGIFIGIIAIIVIVLVVKGIIPKTKPDLEIEISNSIKKIAENDTLNSLTYTYNGIAKKKDSNENDLYTISYKGSVNAGLDFNEIKVRVDKHNKKIIVNMPPTKITSSSVDVNSIDTIFNKSGLNQEKLFSEEVRLAESNLEEEAMKPDNKLIKIAEENSINTVKSLTKPMIDGLSEKYELVFEKE